MYMINSKFMNIMPITDMQLYRLFLISTWFCLYFIFSEHTRIKIRFWNVISNDIKDADKFCF